MINLKYQQLIRTSYFWLMFQVSMINVSTYLTISLSEIGKYQTSLSSFISFRLFLNQYPKLFPHRLAYDSKAFSWSLFLVLSEWFAHLILSFMYTSQIFWTLYIYSKPNANLSTIGSSLTTDVSTSVWEVVLKHLTWHHAEINWYSSRSLLHFL